MTTQMPAQCHACVHLTPGVDPSTGTPIAGSCRAYPDGIPFAIVVAGADHRTARGDEMDGLTFQQADTDAARSAFDSWQRTFGQEIAA